MPNDPDSPYVDSAGDTDQDPDGFVNPSPDYTAP